MATPFYAGDAGTFKTCTRCQEAKPLTAFAKGNTKSGLRAACKACCSGFEKARRVASGGRNLGIVPCARCAVPFEQKGGLHKYCEPCGLEAKREAHRQRNKRYEAARPPRKRDPEEAKARNRRYVERHPHRVLARCRRYNEANREEINRKSRERSTLPEYREWRREWDRRRRSKPKHRVDGRMKAAIQMALRGGKAGRSWEALVGYTLHDLMRHLERQFVRGMTWDNIGEWEIDHVRPRAMFSYETAEDPAFRECWDLLNLRPLWAHLNREKSAKRIFLL